MNSPVDVQRQLSCSSLGLGCYDIEGKTTRLDIRLTRDDELLSKPPPLEGPSSASSSASKSVELKKCSSSPSLLSSSDTKNSCATSLSNNSLSTTNTNSSSGSGSSSTTITSATSKVVRFATDKKGRIACVQHKNRDIRTKKETLDCWFTPNDFKNFRQDCKLEAIKQQKTSYRDNFAAVYAACTKGNFKGVTKERAYVSAASCRGLEVVVFPTLHNDRKNTIATVLKTQAALPDNVSESIREEAIASASRYLSKQARQLARVLGSGDAAVVVANNRIAALQTEKCVVPHCFITC